MYIVTRSHHNPILAPTRERPWESYATFNGCPVEVDGKIHIIYRAMSMPQLFRGATLNLSVIGDATIRDEAHVGDRRILIEPSEEWDRFGCEDPRVTKFGDTYYIFYTALSSYPFTADSIKVAVAVTKDLVREPFEKHLVTPFNAKAMGLYSERVNGKLIAVLTVHTDRPPARICIAEFENESDIWSPEYWKRWYADLEHMTLIDPRRAPTDHVEVGSQPVKTPQGWLLFYSHIQNYHTNNKMFGIEALLFDLNNPRRLIGRTKGAIMVPEEIYELYGHIGNIIFPSGAIVGESEVHIFYGAADTTVCRASIKLEQFLDATREDSRARLVTRCSDNPIISPRPEHPWEAQATFNAGAIDLDGKVHILYRALSNDNTSVIGYAVSRDGSHIDERLDTPVYVPRETFEMNTVGGGGCEDPRLISLNERIYMCYTAFDGIHHPKVAISSISHEDFLTRRWNWSTPVVITPEGVDDKDTCIFPERIGGRYMILHRVSSHICADFVNSLDFTKEQVTKCIQLFGPRPGMWDGEKIGIASPPIKTEKGWLLFYHGVSAHGTYRVGAALLDLTEPTIVLARTAAPLLEPQEQYEKVGIIPNVVFPCGIVLRDGELFIYYGGADKVVALAKMKLADVLRALSS